MRSDNQIKEDVLDELKWDPEVDATEIGVAVKNGVVTLSGYVDYYAKKLAAEKAAKRVKGVLAVAEDITVRLNANSQRDDTAIAQATLTALKWKSSIPENSIQLKVENGWVTLEGNVEWQFQKDAAFNAVRDTYGVRGVTNLISLKPKINVNEIEKNIRRALHRNADIEANNIDILADGNKVQLTGKVRSWSERKEIERAVWSSPGVIEVEDDLLIATTV